MKDPYSLAADMILSIHVLFVAFVLFGLMAIFTGALCKWSWVCNRRFRIFHLIAIGVVVLQSWFGVICPLTTLEMKLRERAGEAVYDESFIQHWFGELLYYEAPMWVFTLCYTAFAAVVLASWFRVPPHKSSSSKRGVDP